MTGFPSAILNRAADLIRDTAAAATPGPWFTHDTHLNAGGHTATVLSGVYPEGQLRAWLPTWSHEPWDETRNVWNDARWIALMSPAVAPMIEAMLRAAALSWARWEGAGIPLAEQRRQVGKQAVAAVDLAAAILDSGVDTRD